MRGYGVVLAEKREFLCLRGYCKAVASYPHCTFQANVTP